MEDTENREIGAVSDKDTDSSAKPGTASKDALNQDTSNVKPEPEEELYTVRPEFVIPKEELCRKCGQRRIDRSKSRNSILCHRCREEQIRYPFPKLMIPIVLVVLAVIALAMARTPKVIKYYKIYSQAERQASEGEIYPVLQNLMEVMEAYPGSVPVAEEMIELAMEYGYYDAAAYFLNEYLVGKEVSDNTYSKIMGYTYKLDRFYNTSDQMEVIAAEVLSENPDTPPYDMLKERLSELLEDDDYDKTLLYYYLASFTEDQKEARGYLEESVKADSRFNEPLVLLGTNMRRSGDFEGAKECYEKVYSRDHHDAGALRALGILCLLEGEKERGLELVNRAYEENPELAYVKETLIIACLENGDNSKAEEYQAQFENEGTEFDEEFGGYLSGRVSLHDYYVDAGEGEL